MASSDLLVRVQELGGQWVPIGSEKSRGIWFDPTDLNAQADSWGTSQFQGQLRYDPRKIHPQLTAFTPFELEVGGFPAASGRINQTPSTDGDDRSITVSGEGWQAHLDDDAYQRVYVHTSMSDWSDVRSYLGSDLTAFKAGGQVTSDGLGLPSLTWPAGTTVGAAFVDRVGIVLDLGADSTAQRVVVTAEVFGNSSANHMVYGFGADSIANLQATSLFETIFSFNLSGGAGATGTFSGTFVTPRRYVCLMLDWQGAATTFTDATYAGVRFDTIQVFASTAYESGGSSILVGSTIALDAVARATLLLSSDQTQVTPTTFPIPEFAMSSYSTPRTAITNALAFDDVIPRITIDRALSIRPRPTLPIYEVGDWAGAQFADASTNSSDEIYDSVVVSGTDASGAALVVRRAQPPLYLTPSNAQPTNPSAAAALTGWTSLYGTLTRDTTVFDTSPASFKCVGTASIAEMQTSSFTALFVPGQTYVVTARYQSTTGTGSIDMGFVDANGANIGESGFLPNSIGAWTTVTWTFSPQTSGTPTFIFSASAVGTATIWLDSISIAQGASTLVDQRGFRRTYVLDTNMALTGASAAAIGDVFLASHRTTPFKGTLTLAGLGSIRRIRGGQTVTPAELMRNTGELILFSHLTDPDTGGSGRYGRIATVGLTGPFSCQVAIDSTDNNFQDLLNRIQVNTAQVR